MKIGELAQTTRCPVGTIRYYEKEGLLAKPERTTANYRSYGKAHVERLRFIRNCRALDMTHGEIRALLGLMDKPNEGCGGINLLLDDHMGHVDARIAELLQLKQQLVQLRQQCQIEQATGDCGILHGLAVMETEVKPGRRSHVGVK